MKKKFTTIGIAHNQLEYLQKKAQGCNLVMLSPLFYNEKYSINKILNVLKFNNKKINWETYAEIKIILFLVQTMDNLFHYSLGKDINVQ